jgi:hypothetical protein
MATWSLCGRHAGSDKPSTPVFINLDNVLTVERQGDLTMVVMVGGENIYIDTMPETLIGAVCGSFVACTLLGERWRGRVGAETRHRLQPFCQVLQARHLS